MFDPDFSEPALRAFVEELQKEAAPIREILAGVAPRLSSAQAGLGSGFGVGLGVGALGGGAVGGVKAYRAARAQGADRMSAAGSSVGGAVHGALRGAATGAALGAGGGAILGAAAPKQVASATAGLAKQKNPLGSFSRFGQRQVHSVTGWTPGGTASSIESIGAGAAPARQAVDASVGRLSKSKELDAVVKARLSGDSAAVDAARKKLMSGPGADLTRSYKAVNAAETSQGMGLTSVPGYAKSLVNNGIVPTVRAGVQEQWSSSTPKGRALMLGLPAYSAAQVMKRHDDGPRGKGETLGRLAGGTLGMVAAPMSLAGGLVMSGGLERAGGLAGKGVDRLRGRKPAVPQEPSRPPATEPGDTGQAAAEHVYGTGYGGNSAGGLE